jgi:hypothetical protein
VPPLIRSRVVIAVASAALSDRAGIGYRSLAGYFAQRAESSQDKPHPHTQR